MSGGKGYVHANIHRQHTFNGKFVLPAVSCQNNTFNTSSSYFYQALGLPFHLYIRGGVRLYLLREKAQSAFGVLLWKSCSALLGCISAFDKVIL